MEFASSLGENLKTNELNHHGVKGMRWGVRRSERQLAAAARRKGRTRKASSKDQLRSEARSLSDDELKKRNKRMQAEKQYVELSSTSVDQMNKTATQKGAKIVSNIILNSATAIATSQLTKRGNVAVDNLFKKPTA